MAKTGRNDPCPCGSGKKYKQCCLARDETSALTKTDPLLLIEADPLAAHVLVVS